MSQETQSAILHNLTATMAPFLDRQQVLRLLDFQIQQVNPIYNPANLQKERLKLLKSCDMYEQAWELECEIRGLSENTDMDNEYQTKFDNFNDKIIDTEEKVDNIKMKFQEEGVKNLLEQGKYNDRQWIELKEDHGFVEDDLDTLFELARLQYNSGEFEEADSSLYLYRMIAPYDHSKHLSSIWGEIANCIQLMNSGDQTQEKFEASVKSLDQLKETIDKSHEEPLKTLQLRSWLLHWALFIYFSKEALEDEANELGPENLVRLCLNNNNDKEENPYKNAIETMCPWMLRYLAVILITSKNIEKKNFRLRRLVEMIDQEKNNYSDPITNFLLSLYRSYDFESAQKYLSEAKQVLDTDYFLNSFTDRFIENGREIIFEMFCRIHKQIKVESIAEKLGMTHEDAELWIVELIKNAKLNAKIDGESGNIIMGSDPVTPYQQIIQKTNNLNVSTQMLIKNLDKRIKAQNKDAIPAWARHGSTGRK